MRYRMGWPLGRVAAQFGIPTLIRIDVIKDNEAGVYVGTSRDLSGLVLEAETMEELVAEAHDVIPCLLDSRSRNHLQKELISQLRYTECHA